MGGMASLGGKHCCDGHQHKEGFELVWRGQMSGLQIEATGFRVAEQRLDGPALTIACAWADAYPVADTTPAVMLEAMEMMTTHRLALWDSVMLAVAAQAGCRMLLSMQHGFTWRGVTVQDPFTTVPIPTPER
jgi:hypothetical protein